MTVRNAGLAVALLVVSAASASGDDVTLRWKFSPDKPYHYMLTQGMEMSMKLPNNDLKTTMSQVSEMTWKVKSVKPDGSAAMSQVIDRMHIKVEGPAGKFEIDSNKKGDAAAPVGPLAGLGKMVEGLVGVPVDVTISARGEVLSVNVPDKMMEAMKTAGPGGQAFAGAFTEKGIKQLFEQSSVVLPEKAVAPGTTWVQKRSVETAGLGNMDIDTTYTDKGEVPGKPGLRMIDGAVKMQIKPGENSPVTMRVIKQDNAAKFLFNTTAGHLSSSEIKQNMQMEISAQGQTLKQDLVQTVSMKLAGDPVSN
jgi:hypothetical protein